MTDSKIKKDAEKLINGWLLRDPVARKKLQMDIATSRAQALNDHFEETYGHLLKENAK
ncbi:MAG: hypothetical protein JKY81_01710 [Colwellia sp.]|nr:hypothetical protein [Colwellia sp.]